MEKVETSLQEIWKGFGRGLAEVGKMYGAKTTPHMYVINGEGVLVYEGAYTDSRRGGEEETNYVVGAVMAADKGEKCEPASTRPWGCGVKYPR